VDAAVEWLLASDEPAVRYIARRDLLGDDDAAARSQILDGPKVRALFTGQQENGGFGGHPYRKWDGAHWRLVSLVELEVPPGEPRAIAAAGTVLDWLAGKGHRSGIQTIDGLTRRCASQEGNALAVCSRLGMADDPRVALLASSLIEWQWPDGGWNCDRRASGRRSSFNESLPPAWGLWEHWRATGDRASLDASRRTAELFLDHEVYKALRTGEPAHRTWTALHYPAFWHYDMLRALVVLARMGLARDPRTTDALDLLERRRLRDGTWRAGGRWWKPPGSARSNVEVVDWGTSGPNEMITLNALQVLHAAGRAAA
jgi:hypothetical protein